MADLVDSAMRPDSQVDRIFLINLFRKINAVEAQWALRLLEARSNPNLTLHELSGASDCLCKINDHAQIDAALIAETERAERLCIKAMNDRRLHEYRGTLTAEELAYGPRLKQSTVFVIFGLFGLIAVAIYLLKF